MTTSAASATTSRGRSSKCVRACVCPCLCCMLAHARRMHQSIPYTPSPNFQQDPRRGGGAPERGHLPSPPIRRPPPRGRSIHGGVLEPAAADAVTTATIFSGGHGGGRDALDRRGADGLPVRGCAYNVVHFRPRIMVSTPAVHFIHTSAEATSPRGRRPTRATPGARPTRCGTHHFYCRLFGRPV